MPAKKRYSIVFIHGLAKKPSPEKLEEIWRWGIERADPNADAFPNPNPGINLNDEGVPCLFNYYADVFYGTEYETEFGSYYEANPNEANNTEVPVEKGEKVTGDITPPQPRTPREQKFIEEFERKLREQPRPPVPPPPPGRPRPKAEVPGQLEIASWLPGPVTELLIKKAAMEAYYFLFDKEYSRGDGQRFKVRGELRGRLLEVLRKASEQGEKIVLVTHSMGTMVAYDVVRNCADCPPVDTLFTLGSPLGIKEVQDELRIAPNKLDFPDAKLRRWVNVYDPFDVVCGADPDFSHDYAAVNNKEVEDIEERNWGNWRHTITHYFAGKKFRAELAKSLGITLS